MVTKNFNEQAWKLVLEVTAGKHAEARHALKSGWCHPKQSQHPPMAHLHRDKDKSLPLDLQTQKAFLEGRDSRGEPADSHKKACCDNVQ